MNKGFTVFSLLFLTSGLAAYCASSDPQCIEQWAELARQHVFMVDTDGKSLDPAFKWGWVSNKWDRTATASNPSVRCSLTNIAAGIEIWRTNEPTKRLASSGLPPRIVVFVHGGMNPYAASRDRLVGTNLMCLETTGDQTVTNHVSLLMAQLMASNCYPVFVVWDSGPLSAFWQHLWSIRQGQEEPLMGPITSPFMLASDLARGLVRLPMTLSGRIYNDFSTTQLPRNSTADYHFGYRTTARWEGFETLINTNLPASYHPPQPELNKKTWSERNLRMAEYIVTGPIKIASLPILDGLGTESWDIMLRRTRTMFEPTSSYEVGNDLRHWRTEVPTTKGSNYVHRWLNPVAIGEDETDWTNNPAEQGAMHFFAASVAEWSTNSFRDLPFEFYGHSMGTIVLNELFRHRLDIVASRIVYLGAACSIEDYESAMFPYLQVHTNTQFYSLSLHRQREREEYALACVKYPFVRDVLVRGSLLNWVDDIFAKPNNITDRTMGVWENITRALPDIPPGMRKQTHFRGCDIEGLDMWSDVHGKIEPQAHGDFSRAMFWSTNFVWPVGTNQLPLRPE